MGDPKTFYDNIRPYPFLTFFHLIFLCKIFT
jgi:hypothetical protein